MTFIGISGKKQSGKNTCANLITNCTTRQVHEFAFALELKKEIAAAFGVTVQHIETNKEKYRKIMQEWGSLRREQHTAYWIARVYMMVTKLDSNDIAIVTDVRYKNEADSIRKIGGILLRIDRPASVIDNHQSETDLDDYVFDHNIINTGSLAELQGEVRSFCERIKL